MGMQQQQEVGSTFGGVIGGGYGEAAAASGEQIKEVVVVVGEFGREGAFASVEAVAAAVGEAVPRGGYCSSSRDEGVP